MRLVSFTIVDGPSISVNPERVDFTMTAENARHTVLFIGGSSTGITVEDDHNNVYGRLREGG